MFCRLSASACFRIVLGIAGGDVVNSGVHEMCVILVVVFVGVVCNVGVVFAFGLYFLVLSSSSTGVLVVFCRLLPSSIMVAVFVVFNIL